MTGNLGYLGNQECGIDPTDPQLILHVSPDHIKNYYLDPGYETAGLDEFKNLEGKCLDCGIKKLDTTGIVTEVDELEVTFISLLKGECEEHSF